MQDKKALQAGTSHNLGQNFAKVFDLKFQSESGSQEFAWNTSWGVSTRLIGGLVMTHGDDKGVRIPPLLAPTEIVVVPIYRSDEERGRVLEATTRIVSMLTDWERRDPGRLRVHLDARQGVKPGAKYYEWELRGVPIRMEIGPKDLEKNQAMLVRRDTGEKRPVSLDTIGEDASDLLTRIQADMLAAARAGLGISTLSCFVAAAYPDLIRVAPQKLASVADLWLLAHPDLVELPAVRAVIDFVTASAREDRVRLRG